MKKKTNIIIGIILIVFSLIGLYSLHGNFKTIVLICSVILLVIGIYFIVKGTDNKVLDMDVKEIYTFKCDLKSTASDERQIALKRLFDKFHDSDVDKKDEVDINNYIKFQDELDTDLNEDKIFVLTLENDIIGSIPYELNGIFRKDIKTSHEFESYLKIFKEDNYSAYIEVIQKR